MNIVFLTHPLFLGSQSMPRYAKRIADGMTARNHTTELWTPQPKYFHKKVPERLKKWMGYIDQYIVFPNKVKKWIRQYPENTLFVFTDHALGPWVPLVKGRPHIIHCHDFMAQKSALGEIPENPTSLTGRIYQWYIRYGYRKGRNFISISQKTKEDLHRFLGFFPTVSEIVFNGINPAYKPANINEARKIFGNYIGKNLEKGYLLHIGGNQWYKNRNGIIEAYNFWRIKYQTDLPLLLIGEKPNKELNDVYIISSFKKDIYILEDVEDKYIRFAYAGAVVFIFPSLDEGFGLPIAEAMACTCPVITTNKAPMTEAAGTAGFLIPRKPADASLLPSWVEGAALQIQTVVKQSPEEKQKTIEACLNNAKRFDNEYALNSIEKIYQQVLASSL